MNRIFIFFLSIVFVSCVGSEQKKILPPDKMKFVLWDMITADEMADYYFSVDSSLTKLNQERIENYQHILQIHQISKSDFKNSLSYYQTHPVAFKPVLDSLQSYADRLQKRDTASKKIITPAQRITHP